MTQNIYDDPEFFEHYSRLPRSISGLDGAPEWPALQALLPNLRGRNVVDLGCGYGWFCRWAREQGAAQILGIDVSKRMLTRARAVTGDPAINYVRADIEGLDLPEEGFDLVYSSLALHYVLDLGRLFTTVKRALVVGGSLVFSVEHPIFTAPIQPSWSVDARGHKTWPIDSYLVEGPRRTDWLTKGVIKHHRTLASYVNLLLRSGFALSHVEEWGPTEEQIAAHAVLADERQRPPFLIIAAQKSAR